MQVTEQLRKVFSCVHSRNYLQMSCVFIEYVEEAANTYRR